MFVSELDIRASRSEPGVFVLLAPLIWKDEHGEIAVPAGTRTDFASIPRAFQNLPFLNVNGISRRPAVLHDYLYNDGRRLVVNRAHADELLRDALLAEGADWFVTQTFYRAVQAFGWLAWG